MERDMESIMRAVGVEWCAVEVSRGWADDNKRELRRCTALRLVFDQRLLLGEWPGWSKHVEAERSLTSLARDVGQAVLVAMPGCRRVE